jgi:pimeloyl-ACP methyl ester carboxylesterase
VARRILKYATMGPGSAPVMVEACARIVHACPRGVRHSWSRVLELIDLDHGVRGLTVPTAVVAGTADRLTPVVHARALVAALPHCVGSTELAGIGHMTPVEAPELVGSRIRELVAAYVVGTEAAAAAETAQAAEIKEGA